MNTRTHILTSTLRPLGALLLLLALAAVPSAFAAAYTWSGGTSTDWNTPANWSGTPAAGWNPTVNLIPANICTITANPTYNPGDVFVGNAASTTGQIDHRAGTLTQNVVGIHGNWFFLGSASSTAVGTYNLADTSTTGGTLTGFGQGSGNLTIGKLWVGGRDNLSGGVGTMNINTTGTLAAQSTDVFSQLSVASVIVGSGGGTGTLNMDSGTVTNSFNMFIADGSTATVNTTGTVNMSGGTFSSAGTLWMCTNNGTATTTGTLNITNATFNVGGRTLVTYGNSNTRVVQGTVNVGNGGTLNSESDLQLAFAGSGSGTGVVNIATGGIVNVGTTTTRWLVMNQWDPVNATLNINGGTLNLNANSAVQFDIGNNATGNAVINLNSGAITMWGGNKTGIAMPSASAAVIDLNHVGTSLVKHTVNLNGGTMTIGAVISTSTTGTRVFNFNGGTLKPTTNNASFFASGRASTANVRNGGVIIDDNGYAITVGQALLHSSISGDAATDGGLTKKGGGTLTLTGANTFNGPVAVGGGTLYANPGNAANNRAFSFTSSITVSNGATLQAGPNGLFGWDGTQEKPVTVNTGGTLTCDSGADVGVSTVTLAGGTLANLGASAAYGSWRFDNAGDKLVVSDDSTASAVNVKFANGGAIDVAAGKTLNFTGTITDASSGGNSTVVKSGGTGTLDLSGANTYTGTTTISNGTLKLSGSGSIASTTNIIVASGATFDVSAAGFTLGAGKTLRGSGTVTGSVTTAGSTSMILPGSSVGAFTFNNNLDLGAGGSATFELSTVYNTGNDQIVVGGNLTLSSSGVIHISGLGGATDLDTTADYVLFSVAGTTTMATIPTLVWDGTKPGNYLNYTLVQDNNNVVLRYTSATAPTVGATVAPASVTRNQPFTITATVTNGSGNIASVMANLSSIGSSSTASLVLSNDNVYTNTFTLGAGVATGSSYSMLVSVTDDTSPTPLVGTYTITSFTVVATNQVWNGAGGDDNWSSNPNWTGGTGPGLVGDKVTFAGTTRLTPNLDTNYNITGLTFDGTAGSFDLVNTAGAYLTLAGGVTNNSANPQTISLPLALSGAQTFSAAAGDLTLANAITNGGSAVTVSGVSNTVLSGSVTGSGSFTKTGAGTLTVSGSILSTGTAIFNASTSVVSGAVAPGASELWVSDTSGNSTLNVPAGGTVTVSNWLVMGRNGATGTLNVNGGAVVHAGSGNITLGSLGTTPTGTINLNSGSISNLAGETYLGEGSSAINFGIYNQAGGNASLGNFYVGRGAGGGQGIGTATVSGGTLNVASLEIGYGNNNTRIGTNVMTIGAGATINATNFVRLAYAGSSKLLGMLTNNGGTLNVGATALYLSYWPDGCSGHVVHNSGAINLQNNASIIFGQNGAQVSTNDFVQNGGTVTCYSDAGTTVGGTGSLNLGNSGGGSHSYTLAGGTLTVPQVRKASGTATGTFNFNGGTLKAAAGSATFMQGLTAANVMAAGATIDTAGNNITVGQALLDGGGSGGLIKTGNGILTLSGASTYTGNTTISNGTLLVNGSLVPASPVTVIGGTLGGNGTIGGTVTIASGGNLAPGTASIGTLTINNSLTLSGTVSFRLNKSGATLTSDQIAGATGVTAGGTLAASASGDTLADGDTFILFNITPNSVFAATNLPAISETGTNWWTTNNYQTITYNVWPTSTSPTVHHSKGITLRMAVADLVSGATNSKAITVTSLGSPSVSGATVQVSGAYVLYTPGPNDANDSFTYSVSDGRGGSASGTVNVIADTGSVFGQTSPQLTAVNGEIQVKFYGVPGYTYVVQSSTNLTDWADISTNSSTTESPAFTVTNTPEASQAYFRLKY